MKGLRKRESNPVADVSPEVVEYTTELALALNRRGVSLETIVLALSKTSYAPTLKTLSNHMDAIERG